MWQITVTFKDKTLADLVFFLDDLDSIYFELTQRKVDLTTIDEIKSKNIAVTLGD